MLNWQMIMIGLAALGGLDASYIAFARRKPNQSRLLGRSCQAVLNSKWRAVFYFSNEALGIFFYIGVIVLILSPYVVPQFAPLVFILLLVSVAAAFGFSVFLFCLQAFVLRIWCSWCLAALSLNLLIFIAEASLFW